MFTSAIPKTIIANAEQVFLSYSTLVSCVSFLGDDEFSVSIQGNFWPILNYSHLKY